jgi:hypothetical protein
MLILDGSSDDMDRRSSSLG